MMFLIKLYYLVILDTPNAMFEDAKNLDGETFGKGVTKETSSVGADRSAFSWTFANYKEAIRE